MFRRFRQLIDEQLEVHVCALCNQLTSAHEMKTCKRNQLEGIVEFAGVVRQLRATASDSVPACRMCMRDIGAGLLPTAATVNAMGVDPIPAELSG